MDDNLDEKDKSPERIERTQIEFIVKRIGKPAGSFPQLEKFRMDLKERVRTATYLFQSNLSSITVINKTWRISSSRLYLVSVFQYKMCKAYVIWDMR